MSSDSSPGCTALQIAAGFIFGSTPDAKRSERIIAEIYQGGLGLPDRDYYLKDDSASAALREKYAEHVARMLQLAGDDSAGARRAAGRVMALETALARASMTLEAQRDPEAVYHLTSFADLERSAPRFGWDAYFKELGITAPPEVNVAQPDYLVAVDSLVAGLPVEDWRHYLAGSCSPPPHRRSRLPSSTRTSASTARCSRVSRSSGRAGSAACMLTDNLMGELLGQAYVRRYFTPEAKARALEMVDNIQAEFRDRLAALTWMTEATKAKAYRKLDAIVDRIGYPDKWRDYSGLEVKRGALRRERPPRERLRGAVRPRQDRQADRPRRMGDDSADGERLVQPASQRDHLPRRHPAAAVLRSQGRRRRELRRHGRRHRP